LNDTFELIKSKVDIVEFAGRYTSLRKQRNEYIGLCPLHQEDTPSFTVDPKKQLFHCFGCHAGGTVIDFVMAKERLDPFGAVEYLAGKLNIDLQQDNQDYKRRKETYLSRERAAKTCQAQVQKDYLYRRGLTDEIITEFQLGYSRKENCVVIPIRDKYGRTVAFARRFLQGEPKYKNSPNDDLYQKAETLFNLDKARQFVTDRLYVVEGYFDVMSLWQQGLKSVVGVCRDSLTEEQAKLIREVVSDKTTIILVPDSDAAGIKSVQRNKELLKIHCPRNHVRVMLLTGKDANECLMAGEDLKNLPTEPADLFLLKHALEGMTKEQQYQAAITISQQAENDMVRYDIAKYLADLWDKPLEIVRSYLNIKNENQEDKLAKLKRVEVLIENYNRQVTENIKSRVYIGYPSLDAKLKGIRPGEVLQYIARSGVGKTTFLLNIIKNITLNQKVPIVFFSLEMQGEAIFERLAGIKLGKTAEEIEKSFLSGLNAELITDMIRAFEKYLVLVDEGGLTLDQMEELVKLAATHIFHNPVRVVMIDYLGYIKRTGKGSSYDQVSELAKSIKEFAKRLNCVVICLHQTSREGESGGKPVSLRMARDSGVVEESADYLLGGWRPELEEGLTDLERMERKGQYMIGILKNRRGPQGTVELKFDTSTLTIRE
jgi:DNA primase